MNDFPEFGALERAGWGDAAIARAYAGRFARATEQAIPSLVAAAEAAPGRAVLDLCCGQGALTAALAGTGATVTGLDFSPAMLDLARRRVPAAELVEGDAQHMPFADDSFDAVVCGFGLMHIPDQERALAGIARVLRPGARLAFTVWAGPDVSPMFALFGGALAATGDPSVALPPAPDFHRFADPAQARPLLEAAGLRDVSLATLDTRMPLDTPGDLFEILHEGTVRVSMLINAQPCANREALARELADRVRRWADEHGVETSAPFALPAPSVLVSARL